MNKKIPITGLPKSGKSTLLHKIINQLSNKTGFVTQEMRENGERTGFKIITSHNDEAILASTKFQSPITVGRYFVKAENMESLLPSIQSFNATDVLYIDEIGQMQLFSETFKTLVTSYLNANNLFIGTLSKVYSNHFTDQIIARKDIELVEVTPENREVVYASIAKYLLIS